MKKILLVIINIGLLLTITGCFKRDNLEDITIYSTVYPVEYATEFLYGYNAEVKSIYPNGVDINKYKLTKKQVNDYAKVSAIFVYNGLSDEKKVARDLLNTNRNLKLIDVSQGISLNYNIQELWLSPTNYLMLTQNIKNSLKEYVTNKYIREEIDANYEELKINISEIDAELKIIAENGANNTIVIGDKALNFLEKYGFNVIDISDKANTSNSTINKVKSLLSNKEISSIFVTDSTTLNKNVNTLKENNNAVINTLKSLNTLSEEDRNEGNNYITIMKKNVEAIQKECYE